MIRRCLFIVLRHFRWGCRSICPFLRHGRNSGCKALIRLPKQRKTAEIQLFIGNAVLLRTEIHSITLFPCQESLLDQGLQIDKIRISGEGREALIRRIAVSRRSHRQHLPVALPSLCKELHKRIGFLPQRSGTIAPRKGKDRHQYACCTMHGPSCLFCLTLLHTSSLPSVLSKQAARSAPAACIFMDRTARGHARPSDVSVTCNIFHHQPFTAPATTPSMMYFWQNA